MNDTDDLLTPQLSPFARELYREAREKNSVIGQTGAQQQELEERVLADLSSLLHKETLTAPESVRITDFSSHDLLLTRLAIFRLEARSSLINGTGCFTCGEFDRTFDTEAELTNYVRELMRAENQESEPLDLLQKMALDNLHQLQFKVRTRKERGIWQYICPECAGHGKITCPSCEGAREFRCHECGGRGDVTCTSCWGSGRVECSSCHGSGLGRCSTCGGTGTEYYDNEYRTCRSCYGHQPHCSACGGSGHTICWTCNSSGKVTCRSCGGRGYIKCGTCKGTGSVRCSYCAGTGALHKQAFVESMARQRQISFCENFVPDTPLPAMTLVKTLRDDTSREIALYAECLVAICTFTVIGPKRVRIPLTVWGERNRQTGVVGELMFPDMKETFLAFSAATIEKCASELAGFTLLKKGFTPHLVQIAGTFFQAPFLAKAITDTELCAASENLALCRARFVAAIRKLTWRHTLPLLLLEIILLAPLLPLQDQWIDSVTRVFKNDPFSNPLALPYIVATLFGVFIGFLCLLTREILRQKIIDGVGADSAAIRALFNADKLARLNFWQNCLLLVTAVLCSGGIAFVYFFQEEIPVWWAQLKTHAGAAWAWFRENVPVWWAQLKSLSASAWEYCVEKFPVLLDAIQSLLQNVWEFGKELAGRFMD